MKGYLKNLIDKVKSLKSKQRKELLLVRKKIFQKDNFSHLNLFDILKNSILFKNAKIIGSYYSINNEIRTKELNDEIINSKKVLCLPAIKSKKKVLFFRQYDSLTNMKIGYYKIMEPNQKSLILDPDLLLIPCVGYDKFGNRIGYGGGYYDMTINKMKRLKPNLVTIIVAHSLQEVENIVCENFDEKIDYILNEKNLVKAK